MSWDEWIFSKAYRLFQRKKSQNFPNVSHLSTLQRSLEVGFQAVAATPTTIQEAKEFVGYYNGILFLPSHIDFLESNYRNSRLYWFITLFHAYAIHEPSFDIERVIKKILTDFPGLIETFNALESYKHDFCQKYLSYQPVFSKNRDRLMVPTENTNASSTEFTLKKRGPNVAKLKELDESQENPLIHIFEKVNTIENYEGGNKSKQSEESLADVADALEEVDLKTVVRSNERTPGLIQTDSVVESAGNLNLNNNIDLQDIFYPEWDFEKNTYKQNWCAVRMLTSAQNYSPILKTSRGQIIKERFESYFNHFQWKNRQPEGPELDLSSVIDHLVTRKIGGVLSDQLFIQRIQQTKDFQILLLVDESLSTESYLGKERVLDMIIESVSDLSQAFEHAPDQLGIFSFFSETRQKCTIRTVKNFSDSVGAGQLQLKKCKPQGYTRIGVAIRHACKILENRKGKRRCLVLFTDAKPTDLDRYEGRYGMADIRKAAEEINQQGIELIVISFSDIHNDRFGRMFGRHVRLFHTPNQQEMTRSLTQTIEKIALNS